MTDVILQYVTQQRDQRPTGRRILSSGLVQRSADTNSLPGSTARLDMDRELEWQDDGQLSQEQLEAIKSAVQNTGFFNLEPRLLINYCKEDPGTTIWIANINGQTHRVVIFDPRPRRSKELDALSEMLNKILAL